MTVRYLENLRHLGRGPKYVRLGNRVRYRTADLEAFAEQNVRTSTSDTGANK